MPVVLPDSGDVASHTLAFHTFRRMPLSSVGSKPGQNLEQSYCGVAMIEENKEPDTSKEPEIAGRDCSEISTAPIFAAGTARGERKGRSGQRGGAEISFSD